jgi:hypothetical protein
MIDKTINKMKKELIEKAKKRGLYENFGQNEVRKIRDKFDDPSDYSSKMMKVRAKIDNFDEWCSTYSLEDIEAKPW